MAKFEVGHAKVGGRKKNEIKEDYLNELIDGWTPKETIERLKWAEQYAMEKGWPKVVVAIHTLRFEYIAGKPVQRVETAEGNAMQELVDSIREKQLTVDNK